MRHTAVFFSQALTLSSISSRHAPLSISSEQPGLLRRLGLFDLTAISLNTIIGSGIFLLPATVAATVGVWAPLSFVVSGVVSLIFALSFAEAGSRFTNTGGPYLYARKAFGDFIGFEVAWIFWLSRLAAVGASYNVFVTYLGLFIPGVTEGVLRATVITLIVIAVGFPNIRGVKVGSFFTNIFTVAKTVPLILLTVAGLFVLDWSRAMSATALTSEDFMRSVLIVAFAYGGFELATVPAGESKDPKKHLPFALLISIGGAAILYILLQFTAYGLFPALGTSQRPLADAASVIIGGQGATLIAIGALVSTCGYIFGGSLVIPRLTYALAEQGQLPLLFGRIHRAFRTPWVSIVFHAVVTWLLAVGLSFFSLVIINVLARLVVTGLTCAAVMKLRKSSPERAVFQMPLGPTVPVLGILFVLYLLIFQTKPNELLYGGAALGVGSLLYLPMRSLVSKRRNPASLT
ncbi:MAG: Amino acid permease [Bacteroidetes bacterium]|nr:Amino acid permease [Bacteroidota bacterium]